VAYLNGSKVLTTGSALTFDGTTLQNTNQIKVQTAAGTAPKFWVGQAATGAWSFGSPASQDALVWVNEQFGTETMRLTSTGLGIGTSSPASKLSVTGTSSGVAADINYNGGIATGSEYSALRFTASLQGFVGSEIRGINTNGGTNLGVMAFHTSGTEKMRLDSSGNLGLGVTPNAWLWPNGTAGGLQLQSGAAFSGYNAGTYVSQNWYYNAGERYIATGFATRYEQQSGQHRWLIAPSGTAGNAFSFTQAMTLDASGNLLVGLTSAQGKASIGLASTTNAITDLANFPTASRIILGDTSGGGGNSKMFFGAGFSSSGAGLNAGFGFIRENSGNWGTALTFYTHPTSTANEDELIERARIDSSGNFTLGNGGILYLENTSQFIRGGGSTQIIVGASSGGFYQQVGGSYYLVTTAGGSTSDASLKTNVQQLTGALEKVCAIRGVNFEFLEEPMCTADRGTQLGVIAQEVEAQYPEIVLTNEDGKKTVRYDRLVAPLIEAIKEQQALIQTLTARVAALESN
jgi:hypothetical protein